MYQLHLPYKTEEHLKNQSIADYTTALRFRDDYEKSDSDFDNPKNAL